MQKTNKQKQNPSFSSVSVRLPPRFFLRRLTDTCVLGNLPKIGTGFGKVHASLREIPEGDEKYGRLRLPIFLSFENDEVRGFFVVGTASAGGVCCLLLTTTPLTSPPSFPQDAGIQSPRMADHGLPCALLKTLDSRSKDCGNGVVGTQRQLAGDSRGRKCPVSRRLKEKARRQRTLTLENDEVWGFFVVGTASAGGVCCLLLTTTPLTSPPSFPQDAGIQSPRMADHGLPCALLKTLDSRSKDCGNGVVGTQRQLAGDSRGRKCPVSRRLKEEARRQRTLTLENDGVGFFLLFAWRATAARQARMVRQAWTVQQARQAPQTQPTR